MRVRGLLPTGFLFSTPATPSLPRPPYPPRSAPTAEAMPSHDKSGSAWTCPAHPGLPSRAVRSTPYRTHRTLPTLTRLPPPFHAATYPTGPCRRRALTARTRLAEARPDHALTPPDPDCNAPPRRASTSNSCRAPRSVPRLGCQDKTSLLMPSPALPIYAGAADPRSAQPRQPRRVTSCTATRRLPSRRSPSRCRAQPFRPRNALTIRGCLTSPCPADLDAPLRTKPRLPRLAGPHHARHRSDVPHHDDISPTVPVLDCLA